jgi:WD40 repeat protein
MWLITLLVIGTVEVAFSVVKPTVTAEIDRLIRQLGSEDFHERETAAKKLEAIGEPALAPLRKAATQSDNTEIRRQADRLAQRIFEHLSRTSELHRYAGPKMTVSAIALAPDGRHALSFGEQEPAGQNLRLWDLASGKELFRFQWTCRRAGGLAFSPDGRRALSTEFGGRDPGIYLWDAETGQLLRCLKGHRFPVYSAVFSPDGRRILSCGSDGAVRLWDAETGQELCRYAHPGPVFEAVFSPDGRRALTGGIDKTVRLWDVEAGKELLRIPHEEMVGGVIFSPDGRHALSSSGTHVKQGDAVVPVGCAVQLWNLDTGKELRRFGGDPQEFVISIAFSPDGRRVLCANKDQTVRLWDVETGQELRRFRTDVMVLCVTFSPDGRQALGGTADNTVYVWALPK